jgi:hypothetical protein
MNPSSAAGATLLLTNSKGNQKALPLDQILSAWRFENDVGTTTDSIENVVPAIIAKDAGAYRLIVGQTQANEYNGRGWMNDIRQIEVF